MNLIDILKELRFVATPTGMGLPNVSHETLKYYDPDSSTEGWIMVHTSNFRLSELKKLTEDTPASGVHRTIEHLNMQLDRHKRLARMFAGFMDCSDFRSWFEDYTEFVIKSDDDEEALEDIRSSNAEIQSRIESAIYDLDVG